MPKRTESGGILVLAISLAITSSGIAAPAKKTAPVPVPTAPKVEKKKADPRAESISRKERIIKTLDYGIAEDRLEAIGLISAISDKGIRSQVYDHLIKILADELDTQILIRSFMILGEAEKSEAAKIFIQHLDNQSDDVKNAAIYGLKRLKASSSKGDLIERLKKLDMSKDSITAEAFLRTLGDFKATELSPWAIEMINKDTTTKMNREYLVLFLGEAGGAGTDELLIKLYRDEAESMTIRSYAVNSLAKRKVSSAVPEIKKEIDAIESYAFKKKQQYHSLYMYSVAALVKFGDREAYPRLINAMRSSNGAVRRRATTLLGELKDKRSIDILTYKMEHDPDKSVRSLARSALKEMGVKVKEEEKEVPDKKTGKDKKVNE